MSELTLLVLQLGFLLLLWVFVFAIVYSLRSDLFGQRVRKLQPDTSAGAPAASGFPAAASAAPV
nr:FHA domain-containing protein [Actinomycetota bacterium]